MERPADAWRQAEYTASAGYIVSARYSASAGCGTSFCNLPGERFGYLSRHTAEVPERENLQGPLGKSRTVTFEEDFYERENKRSRSDNRKSVLLAPGSLPGFAGYVLLYLVGAPLAIGISWLGAYMPSVLVADITAGEAASVTFRNLALLGGALTLLYGAQRWAQETRKRKEKRISGGHSLRLIKETLNAEYRNTERPDFHTEFMKLQELHLWSGDLTDRFLTSMASGLEGIADCSFMRGCSPDFRRGFWF